MNTLYQIIGKTIITLFNIASVATLTALAACVQCGIVCLLTPETWHVTIVIGTSTIAGLWVIVSTVTLCANAKNV